MLRAILRIRRLRVDYLPEACGDPAWTTILELFAPEIEGPRMNQAGLAVAVAHTTGLRLVRGLLKSGILRLGPGKQDSPGGDARQPVTQAASRVPQLASGALLQEMKTRAVAAFGRRRTVRPRVSTS
ncbi:MAG TPA: hypothetical protein VGB79_04260 [Allosphingosinicella sp.]